MNEHNQFLREGHKRSNRKKILIAFSVIGILAVIFLVAFFVSYNNIATDKTPAKNNLEIIKQQKEQIDTLEKKIAEQEEQIEALETRLEKYEYNSITSNTGTTSNATKTNKETIPPRTAKPKQPEVSTSVYKSDD